MPTGNQLETEQLFWNQKSKRVYSNVDSKITQKGDVIYADGFESNERFDDFVMRKVKGKVTVDTTPKQDSVAGTPPAPEAPQQPPVKPGYPVIREGEAVAARTSKRRRRKNKSGKIFLPVRFDFSTGISLAEDGSAAADQMNKLLPGLHLPEEHACKCGSSGQ